MTRAASVAATGALVILASFTFDAAPLFVPGVAFTLLGVLTPLWVHATARGAEVRRRLAADRVVEGQPVEATIDVSRGVLGLPGGEVHDPLAGGPVSLSRPLSLLAGRTRAEVRIVARFHRRGLLRIEPPALVVHDCFDLAQARRGGTGPAHELLILPRTEPVRWAVSGRGGLVESGGPSTGEPVSAVDVDGLRPYRPGTPASRIHWPALARGAGLLERRLEPDRDTRPLVLLDPREDGPPEYLDCAVRAAASLTLELARHGGCQLLLPGERRPTALESDLAGWPALHARLALVQGGPAARAPGLRPGRHGPVFYVAARHSERLLAAPSSADSGALVLVLPAALPPLRIVSPSFDVAGCRGYVLGAKATARRRQAA
jgi:uncharacterized protein (DUF58 family)